MPYKDIKDRRVRSKWRKSYGYDWLYFQLGNTCAWCGRTSAEIELEIDHVMPKLRIGGHTDCTLVETLKDFDNGEELRLLCLKCHGVRHSL